MTHNHCLWSKHSVTEIVVYFRGSYLQNRMQHCLRAAKLKESSYCLLITINTFLLCVKVSFHKTNQIFNTSLCFAELQRNIFVQVSFTIEVANLLRYICMGIVFLQYILHKSRQFVMDRSMQNDRSQTFRHNSNFRQHISHLLLHILAGTIPAPKRAVKFIRIRLTSPRLGVLKCSPSNNNNHSIKKYFTLSSQNLYSASEADNRLHCGERYCLYMAPFYFIKQLNDRSRRQGIASEQYKFILFMAHVKECEVLALRRYSITNNENYVKILHGYILKKPNIYTHLI